VAAWQVYCAHDSTSVGSPPKYGFIANQFSVRIAGVKGPRQSEIIPVERTLPAIGQKVLVVCKKFRLLGYRDARGVWREVRQPAAELEEVIAWQELESCGGILSD
jgi:hypothetical protein